jgi:hypothetical protein
MRNMIWMVLALGCGAAQAQDCHLKQYDSIPITQSPQGLTLPVEINNAHKDLAFNLGDSQSGLAADTVAALNLRQTHVSQEHNVHSDGALVQFIAHAPTVKIGVNTVKDMEFLVLPPVADSGRAPGQIGTLVLKNADMELDMAGGKLNLFSADHCPGKTVYWTTTGYAAVPAQIDNDGYIRVQMTLDGKPVTLGLSSETRSSLRLAAAKRLFGLDVDSPGMTLVYTGADGVKYYQYSFRTLGAEGLAIANPAILIRDDFRKVNCIVGQRLSTTMDPDVGADLINNASMDTTCHAGEDGDVGLSVLGKLHLYVSKKEKLLYLTGAGAK